MKNVKTTIKQRELWKQVHFALANYLIAYGSIFIKQNGKEITISPDCRFESCGKIVENTY